MDKLLNRFLFLCILVITLLGITVVSSDNEAPSESTSPGSYAAGVSNRRVGVENVQRKQLDHLFEENKRLKDEVVSIRALMDAESVMVLEKKLKIEETIARGHEEIRLKAEAEALRAQAEAEAKQLELHISKETRLAIQANETLALHQLEIVQGQVEEARIAAHIAELDKIRAKIELQRAEEDSKRANEERLLAEARVTEWELIVSSSEANKTIAVLSAQEAQLSSEKANEERLKAEAEARALEEKRQLASLQLRMAEFEAKIYESQLESARETAKKAEEAAVRWKVEADLLREAYEKAKGDLSSAAASLGVEDVVQAAEVIQDIAKKGSDVPSISNLRIDEVLRATDAIQRAVSDFPTFSTATTLRIDEILVATETISNTIKGGLSYFENSEHQFQIVSKELDAVNQSLGGHVNSIDQLNEKFHKVLGAVESIEQLLANKAATLQATEVYALNADKVTASSGNQSSDAEADDSEKKLFVQMRLAQEEARKLQFRVEYAELELQKASKDLELAKLQVEEDNHRYQSLEQAVKTAMVEMDAAARKERVAVDELRKLELETTSKQLLATTAATQEREALLRLEETRLKIEQAKLDMEAKKLEAEEAESRQTEAWALAQAETAKSQTLFAELEILKEKSSMLFNEANVYRERARMLEYRQSELELEIAIWRERILLAQVEIEKSAAEEAVVLARISEAVIQEQIAQHESIRAMEERLLQEAQLQGQSQTLDLETERRLLHEAEAEKNRMEVLKTEALLAYIESQKSLEQLRAELEEKIELSRMKREAEMLGKQLEVRRQELLEEDRLARIREEERFKREEEAAQKREEARLALEREMYIERMAAEKALLAEKTDIEKKLLQARIDSEREMLAAKADADASTHASKIEAERAALAIKAEAEKESLAARMEFEKATLEAKTQAETAAIVARAEAESRARILEARETRDLQKEQAQIAAEAAKERLLSVTNLVLETVGSGLKHVVTTYRIEVLCVCIGVIVFYYTVREGVVVLKELSLKYIRAPVLIRETSRETGLLPALDYLTMGLSTLILRAGTLGLFDVYRLYKKRVALSKSCTDGLGGKYVPTSENPFADVVLPKSILQQVETLAHATRNAYKVKAPLRHIMFYGPPGTGKTMVAQRLARYCGLDYALMSGGDVSPLGSSAITELNKLFSWAHASKRGLLLFIDEADACLSSRGRDGISDDARNVLSALLYHTGAPSPKIMLVIATNRPNDLDAAVTDRIDEAVYFSHPDPTCRVAMGRSYFYKYVSSRSQYKDASTPKLPLPAHSSMQDGKKTHEKKGTDAAKSKNKDIATQEKSAGKKVNVEKGSTLKVKDVGQTLPILPKQSLMDKLLKRSVPPPIYIDSSVTQELLDQILFTAEGFSGRQIAKMMLNVQSLAYASGALASLHDESEELTADLSRFASSGKQNLCVLTKTMVLRVYAQEKEKMERHAMQTLHLSGNLLQKSQEEWMAFKKSLSYSASPLSTASTSSEESVASSQIVKTLNSSSNNRKEQSEPTNPTPSAPVDKRDMAKKNDPLDSSRKMKADDVALSNEDEVKDTFLTGELHVPAEKMTRPSGDGEDRSARDSVDKTSDKTVEDGAHDQDGSSSIVRDTSAREQSKKKKKN